MQNKQSRDSNLKVSSDNATNNRIKVQILYFENDMAVCKHVMSTYNTKAYLRKGMKLDIGQIVLIEYRRNSSGGGYIIVDELIEIVKAKVLYVQHIFNEKEIMVSMILEDTVTGERIHSVVSSKDELFYNSNTVIAGDIVQIRKNNGKVFSIKIEAK